MKQHPKHSVAMLLYPGVSASDVAGPMECFGLANYISGNGIYTLSTFSSDGAPVEAAGSWLTLQPNHSFDSLPENVDTLLIPGGPAAFALSQDSEIIAWLRRRAEKAARVGSICNGAFVLAALGAADQGKLATHWLFTDQLARLHPDVDVDHDAIYVRSGKVWSSGGMTSGMDLALALIEEDCGRTLAMEVARHMVLYLRRSGGQSQFSMHLKAQFSDLPAISRLQQWIIDNPQSDLRVETLAARAAMSSRSLLRVFKEQTGLTLGKFVAETRLRHACSLLEDTDREQKEVASLSGLGSETNLRKVFMTRLGITPSQYRQRFRATDNTPAGPETSGHIGYDDAWLYRTEVKDFQRSLKRR
ncbi:transcriptional regulator GlxA family with amidase domain [Rhizobium sp. SG_E_25_P2]|uniref:GlxA family transcriptional regulator n=1 Tax=Rhizobium sp. SG_E_25_P2 TaxID=2879942 RepID=UPI0024739552|nr:GlxA family transcriptional regulator [Rhizobium sp. SG_E_25_P2]MDH6268293.1 transcriptional regulator GlxA family with amidase domain [Rhizobium sp. SG_E_25_P2]